MVTAVSWNPVRNQAYLMDREGVLTVWNNPVPGTEAAPFDPPAVVEKEVDTTTKQAEKEATEKAELKSAGSEGGEGSDREKKTTTQDKDEDTEMKKLSPEEQEKKRAERMKALEGLISTGESDDEGTSKDMYKSEDAHCPHATTRGWTMCVFGGATWLYSWRVFLPYAACKFEWFHFFVEFPSFYPSSSPFPFSICTFSQMKRNQPRRWPHRRSIPTAKKTKRTIPSDAKNACKNLAPLPRLLLPLLLPNTAVNRTPPWPRLVTPSPPLPCCPQYPWPPCLR